MAVENIGYIWKLTGGDAIPIVSVDDIQLSRASEWDFSSIPLGSMVLGVWKTQKAFTYPFDFDLLVGWGVDSYKKLDSHVKNFHSMLSHQKPSGASAVCKPPPPVRFLINGMLSMNGVITEGRTMALKPFVMQGGAPYPTRVKFTGNFVGIPGLKADGIIYGTDIDANVGTTTSANVGTTTSANTVLASDYVEKNLYWADGRHSPRSYQRP